MTRDEAMDLVNHYGSITRQYLMTDEVMAGEVQAAFIAVVDAITAHDRREAALELATQGLAAISKGTNSRGHQMTRARCLRKADKVLRQVTRALAGHPIERVRNHKVRLARGWEGGL